MKSFPCASPWIFALTAVMAAPAAPAAEQGLAFATTQIEKKATPEDETVEAVFQFENQSESPVRILDIKTNCGCLKAKSDKDVYQPGEKGTIETAFRVGAQEGVTAKAVTVQTDEAQTNFHRLVVAIDSPRIVDLSPNMTEWLIGEEPVTKSITFKVMHEEPIRITSLQPSRENFECKLVTIEEGREYRIDVTPKATGAAQLGVLRIFTDCAFEKHRRKMAFVGIVKNPTRPLQ